MKMDIEKIFDSNQDEIFVAVGEPKCAEEFRRNYILPAIESNREDGDALDMAYGCVVGAYQRAAYAAGFRAAAQLFIGCLADGKPKE